MISQGATADTRFLRLPEVRERSGLSKSELYRRIRKGTFPKPAKLGYRTSVWPKAVVDRWLWDQIDPQIGDLLA
jgi:prophage regulatory protein